MKSKELKASTAKETQQQSQPCNTLTQPSTPRLKNKHLKKTED